MVEKKSRRQKAHERKIEEVKKEATLDSDTLFKSVSIGSREDFQRLIEALMGSSFYLYSLVEKVSHLNNCVRYIADAVALNELHVVSKKPKDDEEPILEHDLSKPNPLDTQYTFFSKLMIGLLVEDRVMLVKDKLGVWVYYWCNVTESKTKEGKTVYGININGKQIQVPEGLAKVISVPGYKNNGEDTHSKVKSVVNEVATIERVGAHVLNFLQNGMMAKGFLEQTPDAKMPLTVEQLSEISRRFNNRVSGMKAADTVSIPKGLTYKPVQVSLANEGMLEVLKNNEDAIFRSFRLPKSFFDNSSDSYATAQVQEANFYKNSIYPYFRLIEDALNSFSVLKYAGSKKYVFDKGNLLTETQKKEKADTALSMAQAVQTGTSSGGMSLNEARVNAGLTKLDDPKADEIPALTKEPELDFGDDEDEKDTQEDKLFSQALQKILNGK